MNSQKTSKALGVAVAVSMLLPALAFAQTNVRTHTTVGTVTSVSGTTVTFTASNGTQYTVDLSSAKLFRRYGAQLAVSEIQDGDKVSVRGSNSTDPENSDTINAITLKDMSLQGRHGTFVGTLSNLSATSFTLQSKSRGQLTVNFTDTTVFKKQDKVAQASDLANGQTVMVKGVWDRTSSNITATRVNIIIRMRNITFNGSVTGISGSTLTVTTKNGTVYTVDASKAYIVKKFFGKGSLSDINLNDEVQVRGRHVSESTDVMAMLIRDKSLTSKNVLGEQNGSSLNTGTSVNGNTSVNNGGALNNNGASAGGSASGTLNGGTH